MRYANLRAVFVLHLSGHTPFSLEFQPIVSDSKDPNPLPHNAKGSTLAEDASSGTYITIIIGTTSSHLL